MAIMRFNFFSHSIGYDVDVTITYPTDNFSYYDMNSSFRHNDRRGGVVKPKYTPGMKFQTVYLIQGGSQDDSRVFRYMNTEAFALKNNVMIVTPNIANSFGVNTNYGVEYHTFLTEELPTVVQSLFASSPKREDNFIIGYAMGGNVALGTALMRPDLYSVCIDMSGGIGLTLNMDTLKEELDGDHFKNEFPVYCATFGPSDELDGSRHDMRAVAEKNIKDGVQVPVFRFVAGSEEGFIRDRLEDDYKLMVEIGGYDVDYVCVEGQHHDFKLWNEYLEKALDEMLPLKRQAIFPEK